MIKRLSDWLIYPIQWVLVKMFSVVLFTYFNEIRIIGQENVPLDGPLIIAGNHPNMALDPVILSCACGRLGLHFWAKSGLFKSWLGNAFMRAVGAVPVFRSQDALPGQPKAAAANSNDQLYASSYETFDNNQALMLFPEGVSYTASRMMPLKKGAAWLLLGYLRRTGRSVPVVPAGINYTKKDKFRSEVLVEFGQPMYVMGPQCPTDNPDAPDSERVARATRELEAAMAALVVNAPDFETLGVLRTARRIYASGTQLTLVEHVRVQQKFNELYAALKDDSAVRLLTDRVRAYQRELQALRIHDFVVASTDVSPVDIARAGAWYFVRLALLMPLALPGLLLNAPLYALTKLLHSYTSDEESRSMLKGAVLFFSLPALNGSLLLLAYWWFGRSGLLTALWALPLFQIIHVRCLESGVETFRSLRWLAQLSFVSSDRVAFLRRERAEIHRQLVAMANKYVAPESLIVEQKRREGASTHADASANATGNESGSGRSNALSMLHRALDHDEKFI